MCGRTTPDFITAAKRLQAAARAQSSFCLLQKYVRCQNILFSSSAPEPQIGVEKRNKTLLWSHSSTLANVNHSPFSPKVPDAPVSHNSHLELESAVAPAGPLVCFIHRASDGVIQKAVIFSSNSLLHKQWPCRIWWFTIPAEYLFQPSCHFLLEKVEFHIVGILEREKGRDLYLFLEVK